jgi:RHH-type proline utilization regulon transcriptional repressor/proline dehydrogenase/delta 1-pyrroline-5-carboxylate dehydrogenase
VTTPAVSALVAAARKDLTQQEAARVERAARSDGEAWRLQFGVAEDVSQLPVERNVFRYLPLDRPVLVRLDAAAPVADLVRVVAAGALTGHRDRRVVGS